MSPLAYGPGRGTHRVLGIAGTPVQCRVHRTPLGPAQVQDLAEHAAAMRLSADAMSRLQDQDPGTQLPQVQVLDQTQARCPECVRGVALAAAARVMGEDGEDQ